MLLSLGITPLNIAAEILPESKLLINGNLVNNSEYWEYALCCIDCKTYLLSI